MGIISLFAVIGAALIFVDNMDTNKQKERSIIMDWVKAIEIEKAQAEKLIGRSLNDSTQDYYTDGRFVRYFDCDEQAIHEVDTLLKEERHTSEYLACGWTEWVACA